MPDSNARSTKTRIETKSVQAQQKRRMQIRMQDPLKQGLKLYVFLFFKKIFRDSNARSTKTRIETHIED